MTGMWRRWARRRRIVGLGYLTLSAVTIAIAFLVYTTGTLPVAGLLAGFALALILNAVFEFAQAARYARLG